MCMCESARVADVDPLLNRTSITHGHIGCYLNDGDASN